LHLDNSTEARAWPAHDLLRLTGTADLVCPGPAPSWVEDALAQAPFVVVRRAPIVAGMIPVGIRGSLRNQRFAAYLHRSLIVSRITPEQLVGARPAQVRARSGRIPAFGTLTMIKAKLADRPLRWGPTGSVGFELATGLAAATPASDLDLLIRVPKRLPAAAAEWLLANLSAGPSRVDVQLETPRGAVSLAEYARGERPVLLRQTDGPVLVFDPWDPGPGSSRTGLAAVNF